MTNENSKPVMTESAVGGIDMAALLGAAVDAQPATTLEKALANIEPSDAAAATVEEAKFQFRDMLDAKQLQALKTNAPAIAEKMITDSNAIMNFGEPVLKKLNSTSSQLLEAQKKIDVPEADQIVNDLLREVDGYSKKYRNDRVESLADKIVGIFKKNAYSLKTMVRESKPIADKIDMAEVALVSMETKLAENATRGRLLHTSTIQILQEVVAVLAALEEISEVAKNEFEEADRILNEAETNAGGPNSLASVEWKGRAMPLNEFREIHTDIANGVSELEKTWFDWRQQFFLGYAQAPSVRNLILVSVAMQRRCQTFRTMGLPSARNSLVMWQQAALAKQGAEMGTALNDGTNKMIQNAFGATAEAVSQVAEASQAPVISEETIWAVIDSVKAQCDGLVAADRAGRQLRQKNLAALEGGEKSINEKVTDSRRQLVQNAIQATSPQAITSDSTPADVDVLAQLGVKK